MSQEEFQALAFHRWQQQKDAGARSGFDRHIEPEPLILIVYDPRRSFSQRAPEPGAAR
jgi:hypothetical protein